MHSQYTYINLALVAARLYSIYPFLARCLSVFSICGLYLFTWEFTHSLVRWHSRFTQSLTFTLISLVVRNGDYKRMAERMVCHWPFVRYYGTMESAHHRLNHRRVARSPFTYGYIDGSPLRLQTLRSHSHTLHRALALDL